MTKLDSDKIYLYAKDPYEAIQTIHTSHPYKRKGVGLRDLTIVKLLLNAQMMWMIFMKILKSINQISNKKY